MLKLPKITTSQLFIMLLISRMFSIFTYKPLRFNIGFGSATIAIVVSAIINIIIFVPSLIVIRKFSSRNIIDSALLLHRSSAKIYLFLIAIACVFLCVETVCQFQLFMASTIYITWAPILFIIPIILCCVYLCRLGIEALARLSGYIFVSLIISIIAIIISSIPNVKTVWLEPVSYDEVNGICEYVVDNVFHTTEIIPFLFLCSYSKGSLKKGITLFLALVAFLFEAVSFLVISTLGNYRETVLFPFYTVSAMGQTTLSERFNAAFIMLWIFMAVIKICVYLYVSARVLMRIINFKSDMIPLLFNAVIIIIASLIVAQQMSYLNIIYSIIVTGIPVLLLGVIYPFILILIRKRRVKYE